MSATNVDINTLLSDLGRPTRRGVRKCPQCGSYISDSLHELITSISIFRYSIRSSLFGLHSYSKSFNAICIKTFPIFCLRSWISKSILGTINGTRGISCKNGVCTHVFKELPPERRRLHLVPFPWSQNLWSIRIIDGPCNV